MTLYERPIHDQNANHSLSPTQGVGSQADYNAWLLRLWRSGAQGDWRASLQSVRTGERHMFADLESLLVFLCDHARSPPNG